MFPISTIAILALSSSAIAAPTLTTRQDSSPTAPQTGVTHTVVAGLGNSLTFSPDNVVAEIGDVVEWHFLPANHTVAQSNFANPCVPLADGTSFFPGFEFATANGQQADDVFQIIVQNKNPIWYYCPQGTHCQAGMSGVINQNFDGDATLAAYKRNSVGTVTVIPDVINGEAIANPNPLGGF
ncbi:Cupredoxin [Aspergillus granulosus]|uniref:Cupredoxin n=1 Tax=Aspergillus granulosus TaxID=176169 RepID=A0ABR4HI73_9EURO